MRPIERARRLGYVEQRGVRPGDKGAEAARVPYIRLEKRRHHSLHEIVRQRLTELVRKHH